ncbi:MAG TPA: HEAT repeat domain-containing protein [Gemmatimonadales bacterium]|nr:HEAT repeat domain-containing protein [Gemmatimonadales bacterium]
MTTEQTSTQLLPASQVSELIQTIVKALRAFQMYLPNNPIYQRAIQNVRTALNPVWAATDELNLRIAESDLIWEEQSVYHQVNRSESLAWSLFKDGMRELTIHKGAEQDELPLLLATINKARFLPADAGDDLLTLLWALEFESIKYRFIDFFDEGGGELPGPSGSPAGGSATAEERRARAAEEAAEERPKGLIDIDEVDSTLYFLDEDEINYLAGELAEEYKRDVRGSALNVLFDLMETQPEGNVRDEILGVLDQLFPNLLTSRDFRSAAAILRESKLLKDRAPNLRMEQVQRLDGFVARLSEPAIVGQVLQSLDEASGLGLDQEAAALLRELRTTALEPLISWLPNLSSAPLRKMLEGVVDKLAGSSIAEVQRLLRQPDSSALLGVVELCGRLQLHHAVPGFTDVISHTDPAIRLAAVQTLTQLGTPGALTLLDRSIDDADRSVRLAAVRGAGSRGYKGALRRIEAVVLGKSSKPVDLTEKMAFFEAYGAIAGAAGLKVLSTILLQRGLLKMKEPPETRACAAVALGRIKSPEARELLQRAADDKDLVVRNAVNRALRGAAS